MFFLQFENFLWNAYVLSLIDDAGGHNCTIEFLDSLTNFKVHFLQPNCTSVIQPRLMVILEKWIKSYLSLSATRFLETFSKKFP